MVWYSTSNWEPDQKIWKAVWSRTAQHRDCEPGEALGEEESVEGVTVQSTSTATGELSAETVPMDGSLMTAAPWLYVARTRFPSSGVVDLCSHPTRSCTERLRQAPVGRQRITHIEMTGEPSINSGLGIDHFVIASLVFSQCRPPIQHENRVLHFTSSL